MHRQHHVPCLLQGWFQQVEVRYLDVNVCQSWIRGSIFIGGCPELDPRGVQRHVNHVILSPERIAPFLCTTPSTLAFDAPFRFLLLFLGQFLEFAFLLTFVMPEHTDNRERLASDLYCFSNRHHCLTCLFRASKQLVAHACSYDADAVRKFLIEIAKEPAMFEFVKVHFQNSGPDTDDF